MPLSSHAADLYRRFGPLIYARCKRILKDPGLSEDATQEVFLRVWRHIEKAPDDEAALRWMYRISTNYCLNVLRDAARRPAIAEDDDGTPERLAQGGEAGFDRVLEDRDLALRLLSHAPKKLSDPALLHWVDGMEQGKVAETLGVTRRTVINRLGAFAEWARHHVAEEERAR